jgi:hypothetical protein
MDKKKITLISLASALAALAPSANLAARTEVDDTPEAAQQRYRDTSGQPNTFYNLGEDLMGLVTSTAADGTIVAQHYSHSSHASHVSHRSHYSGS